MREISLDWLFRYKKRDGEREGTPPEPVVSKISQTYS